MIKAQRHFTGKLCSACGKSLPWSAFHRDARSADGYRFRCKACVKVYDDSRQTLRNNRARQAYAADPQSKVAQTRRYHLEHPEWSRERLRAHHVANRDERYRRYLERGKDPLIAEKRRSSTQRSESRRRAIKRNTLVAVISAEQFDARFAEFNGCCYICETPLSTNLHWDHFRPLVAGGSHTLDNLFPACDLCNLRKNACWPFTNERREEIKKEVLALRKQQAARTGGR